MKKISLLLVAVVMMCAACSVSPEKKAEKLMKEEVLKTLYIPDSYEHIETKVDSTHAPAGNMEIYRLALKLTEASEKIDNATDEINSAKSSKAIHMGPYMSEYDKARIAEEDAKIEKLQNEIDEYTQKGKVYYEKIVEMLNCEPEWDGFLVTHKYRAKANNGNVLINTGYAYTDKELKTVKALFGEHDTDMIKAMELLTAIRDELDSRKER